MSHDIGPMLTRHLPYVDAALVPCHTTLVLGHANLVLRHANLVLCHAMARGRHARLSLCDAILFWRDAIGLSGHAKWVPCHAA